MDPPSPSYIVLRAATLAIDDLCRQRVRDWVLGAVDFRGDLGDLPAPDPLVKLFAVALATVSDTDRRAYRQWLMRWTDFTGRIITRSERERRLAAHPSPTDPPRH